MATLPKTVSQLKWFFCFLFEDFVKLNATTQHKNRNENETATEGRHPTEILKQHRSKEDGSHKAYSKKNPPYQEVLVVLPNEGVERGDYVMLLLHLPVFERAKIRIIFQPLK